METILILGGFGFLGTNLINYASNKLSNDYRFIVFDIYNEHPLGAKFNNVHAKTLRKKICADLKIKHLKVVINVFHCYTY